VSNARDLAADLLLRYDRTGTWVGAGIEAARSGLTDPRERGLLTEIAYGCVRRQGTLAAVLSSASKRPVPRLNAALRTALRVGLYQVLFLDRVPAHAAVDHAVRWSKRHAGPQRAGYVNGVLRSLLRGLEGAAAGPDEPRRDVPREDGTAVRFARPVFPDPQSDEAASLAGRYSMPTWIVRRWLEQWGGERTATVLRAGITRPPLTLRARRGQAALADALKARDLAFEAGAVDGALLLRSGEGVVAELIGSREAAVQDATGQRVAPLLAPQGGERILDLCAAPGGKTLHLADLMGAGALTACDVDEAKVARLQELGASMPDIDYRALLIDAKAPLPFEPASFDGILVDAPCTNTGVLRRRVEVRWRLEPGDVTALAALQLDLLERCLPVLRPGGRLVYSTCSLEAEENEGVVEALAARHPELACTQAFRVWPGRDADGGYAAVVRISGSP